MNRLQKIMATKIDGCPQNGKAIIPVSTVKTAATFLRNHKQTNKGKNYEINTKD